MIVENFKQGSDEWLQARCGVVTASNFGRVIAKGSGKTRKTYMQKLAFEIISGKIEGQTYYNDAMIRGNQLEPQARKSYIAASNNNVQEVGLIFLNNDKRISASPDGLIGKDGGLEIKCPLPHTHKNYVKRGSVPTKYMPQIQGNLWICKREWWDFVSYAPKYTPDGKNHIFIRRVYRDEAYISQLEREIKLFIEELDILVSKLK